MWDMGYRFFLAHRKTEKNNPMALHSPWVPSCTPD